MSGKHTAVFGIYPHYASVERGVDALKLTGFSNSDISVLFPENEGTKDFAHQKSTKAPEGASAGAGTGAILGGGLGWLAGIGALAIPGQPGAVHRCWTDWRRRWRERASEAQLVESLEH